MNLKYILLLGLIIGLSACGTVETATPFPTPEAISIHYPPEMQFWANQLAHCAADNPLVALYFLPGFSNDASPKENDIILDFGQATYGDATAYLSQVARDQIVVIVNKANQVSQLSADALSKVYTGQSWKWTIDSQQPIQFWVLPENDPVRKIFDDAVITDQSLSSDSRLAPDTQAMLEAVSQNENAIGYLPESYLSSSDSAITEKVRIVTLGAILESELNQSVVVITHSEPRGLLRDLVVCLQDSGN